MGEGIQGGEEETEVIEEIIEEVEEQPDPELEILNETVEQTIERSKREAAEAAESSAEQTEGKAPDDTGAKQEKPAQKTGEQEQPPAEPQQQGLAAPDRFTAEAKEAWAKAPRVLQEQYKKAIDDLHAGQNQKLREIHEVKVAAETIVKGVEPWVRDWAQQGISAPQGIALLCQTHANMVENPAKELARLATDNGVSAEQIQSYINGTGEPGEGGTGFGQDISNHPQFRALQEKMNSYDNERHQAAVQAETDKIAALREETDANGNRPYGRILDPEFLEYARPLVAALRTPPRGTDGKFISGPMPLYDAYKRAYHTWASENGISPQTPPAASPQPEPQTQPEQTRKQAQPVSMRPRSAPVGATPISSQGDTRQFRHETVEETIARLRNNNWQEG